MSDGGLRKSFSDHLTDGHWQAVETWSTGQGVPDTNYCFPGGIEGWIEFKKTEGWRIDISAEQVAWAERRIRLGGRVFLGVRRQVEAGRRREKADELWLFTGLAARFLISGRLQEASHLFGRWDGGPRAWPWVQIRNILISQP